MCHKGQLKKCKILSSIYDIYEWRLDRMVVCGVVLIGLMWREIETLFGAISIDIILGLSWSEYDGVGLLNMVYV
jgi:hypothetical protein